MADVGIRFGVEGEREFNNALRGVESQIRNLKSDIKATTAEMGDMDDAEDAAARKSDLLARAMDATAQKIKLLEGRYESASKELEDLDKALEDAKEQYGEHSAEAIRAANAYNAQARRVNELGTRINNARTDMANMRRESEGLTEEVEDLGEESESAGMSLKNAFTIGAVSGGIQALISGIGTLVEETKEYRKIMGSLEVASRLSGYTAKETAKSYKDLYGVLGDQQQAATALSNAQALGLEQEKLDELIKGLIGSWAKYGDSIPIDGLAEAVNETAQVGKVTGTFADVLNWAGTSEDEFNEKLAACSTTAERADLIMQELSRQGLTEAADAWKANNEELVKANENASRLDEIRAELAETFAPTVTGMQEAVANLAEGFLNLTTGMGNLEREVMENVTAWEKMNEESKAQAESNLANIDYAEKLITELQGLTNANGEVSESDKKRADALFELVNNLLPGYVEKTQEGTRETYKFADGIKEAIKQKKAMAVLDAYQDDYSRAIKEQAAAQKELIDLYGERNRLEQEYANLEKNGRDVGVSTELSAIRGQINDCNAAIEAQQGLINSTNELISGFEGLQEAISAGNYDEAISKFNTFGISMKDISKMTASELKTNLGTVQGSMKEIIKALENPEISAEDASVLTELMKVLADQEGELMDQMRALGIEVPETLGEGIRESTPNATTAATETKDGVVAALEFQGEGAKKGQEGGAAFSAGLDGQKTAAGSAGKNVADSAKNPLEKAKPDFKTFGEGSGGQFATGVESKKPDAESAGSGLVSSAKSGAANHADLSGIRGIGENFGNGFVGGIKSKLDAAFSAGKSLANKASAGAKEGGLVRSPSRVMREIGGYFGEGFNIGVSDKDEDAEKAGKALGKRTIKGVSGDKDAFEKAGTASAGSYLSGLGDVSFYPSNLTAGGRALTDSVQASMAARSGITSDTVYSAASGVVTGMSAAGTGGGEQTIIVPVYLDGTKIAEASYDPLKNIARQRGD